ncbi:hypothetical protein MPSEU_000557800 [Mayamaea pseudoterrestris]|nr:hypothetical protein MPSEU_000557800 [Mayamaea pseudoterrestris]
MSDQGDDGFGQQTLEHLHNDTYDAAAHEPLPYAPQHESDASLLLPPQQHDDLLIADDQQDDDDDASSPRPTDSHLESPEELYAEATAAVEAAAAASLENPHVEDIVLPTASGGNAAPPMDINSLQSALASKEAEVEALKKALKRRDRQLIRQASQQSTSAIIGEAVLKHAKGEDANNSNLISAIDPNKISNLEQRWKARFQQLVCFKLKHGHSNVPKSFDASLHAWVRKQRVNKQLRDKTQGDRGLSVHQVEALDALDFDWYVGYRSLDDQWDLNYQKVLMLSHAQGHLETTSDKSLNKWMQNQRARRKLLEQKGAGKAKGMTWERVHKLDAINFRWETRK